MAGDGHESTAKASYRGPLLSLVAVGTLVGLLVAMPGSRADLRGSFSGVGSRSLSVVEEAQKVHAAAAAAPSAEGSKVIVEVYGSAGCPFTRAFVEGPLAETVAVANDLIDLRFHTFGNSYHATERCGGPTSEELEHYPFTGYFHGYDSEVRNCWDLHCGANTETPDEDCFDGKMLCQHGAADGMVTAAWACAKSMSQQAPKDYMPFVLCTAFKYFSVTSESAFDDVISSCAVTFSAENLLTCSKGEEGKQLLQAEARATVPHPGIPYVVIDGELLETTNCVSCQDGIMVKVCQAWRAKGHEDSEACKGIFGLL
eukprot:CAMPEP_0206489740 /NCGR_PEP_ID=MMETSP0324_2-20121206/43502_1 /ASSEMBLY_ACC=CAM_ASM_000836 /TAXON_ID=2866 /ORGANISM="Crypthecodinium cohnii, Strain Seligo" /LENGTH=313 /DNA_ID=CAMNT_0053969641 /DNA_START=158 /DNA_END=1099 /DNA_ORIENTATION=-